MQKRNLILAVMAIAIAVSGVLLAKSRLDYEVDPSAVIEIWADLMRDVDHVGLAITRVSAEREMEIGEQMALKMGGGYGLANKEQLERYVTEIGEALAKNVQRKGIRYRFHVINSSVINAYAIPGGHIYVTTGLLGFAESEAELAAVIGHEISHVDLRHCIERLQYELAVRKMGGATLAAIAGIAHELVVLGFSEQQELEADANGVILAAKAGYDPRAAHKFDKRLVLKRIERLRKKKQSGLMIGELGQAIGDAFDQYFATHPPTPSRVRQFVRLYGRNESGWLGKRFYLGRSNIENRIARATNDWPEEWVIYDESPKLAECTLPTGYIIPLTPDECIAAINTLASSPSVQVLQWKSMCNQAANADGAARSAIGWHYFSGWEPVQRNLVQAYKWFTLAIEVGYSDAKAYRQQSAVEMTPEQIAEAERLVTGWKPDTCETEAILVR